MINSKGVKQFCSEDISKIENYAPAVADATQTWDCHHRLQILEHRSQKYLKENGLYFHRPASELIFLTHKDHMLLHKKWQRVWNEIHRPADEAKRKISDKMRVRFSDKRNHPNFGRHLSDETKKKLSEKAKARFADPENHPMFGKHMSEYSKNKISESNKGRAAWNKGISPSEESKKKMSDAHKGVSPSESTRAKQSEIMKKKIWVTNGTQNLRVDPASIPNGWTRGRTRLSN